MRKFLAATIQLQSTSDIARNLRTATQFIERAAARGARFVATPENTNFLGPHEVKVRSAERLDGPTGRHFADLASRLGIYLLIGSINERSEEVARCYNTSLLFSPMGELVTSYRKIHLFDVDVSSEVCFRESDTIRPGTDVVCAETALGTFGLSICYDLRFAELYRELTERGAQILLVPSAFTLTTGRDHWYPLLRARAIENQCYVIAPAQWGHHDDQGLRNSFGHSLIIDPWGHVLASVSDGEGIAIAEIDLGRVAEVRQKIPMAEHRKL